jgi:hypothetical protein
VSCVRASWAALVAACALGVPTAAHAYCRLTTAMPRAGDTCSQEGEPLYWVRQCLGYSVVPRDEEPPALADLRNAVDESFGTWGAVQCDGQPIGIELQQTVETAECIVPEYNPTGPNANAVIFVRDWEERNLPMTAFGLTLVWHHPETGEIFDADVQVNETLGELTICEGGDLPKCPSRTVDIRNVVTHEAGHYLGLGHTTDDLDLNPTMAASAVLGETAKRTLAADDRAGVCAIYGEYAPIECEPSDFRPNNGFNASCYFPETDGLACGACAVLGASRASRPALFASFALFVLFVGYRWRRRVVASTSSPRPRNR